MRALLALGSCCGVPAQAMAPDDPVLGESETRYSCDGMGGYAWPGAKLQYRLRVRANLFHQTRVGEWQEPPEPCGHSRVGTVRVVFVAGHFIDSNRKDVTLAWAPLSFTTRSALATITYRPGNVSWREI
jgi:hypothetical protein